MYQPNTTIRLSLSKKKKIQSKKKKLKKQIAFHVLKNLKLI